MKARSVALAAGVGALALLGPLLPTTAAGAADPMGLLLYLSNVGPRTNIQQGTFGWTTNPRLDAGNDPVTWVCTVDGAPYYCPNDAPLSPGAGHLTTPASLAEGPHSITVTTSDPRVTPVPLVLSWYVDVTPPQVSITAPPSGPVTGSSVFVGVTTVDQGPDDGVSVICSAPGHMDPFCASGSTVTTTSENHYTFSVQATDAAGNSSGTAVTSFVVDHTPPVVTADALAPFVMSRWITSGASAYDAWTHVDELQLRTRWAATDGGLSSWSVHPPTTILSTYADASKTLLVSGTFGCVAWRAKDAAGHLSAWSPSSCTSAPVDEKELRLVTTGWTSTVQSGSYLGRVLRTSSKDRALSVRALATQVGVVATTCPACGTVGVWVGPTYVGKVSLTSSTVKKRQVRWLPAYSSRSATVTLRTLTSGRPVYVDGLAFRR